MRYSSSRLIVLSSALLFIWGCATPPTMRDVEELATDDVVVFGSAAVFEDGEQETWGTKWTGHNFFYLTVLPPDSNEAITYELDKDGVFFWALPPGDYRLLGYFWQDLQARKTGHIGASFSVPEAGPDLYLGSIEFRGTEFYLVPNLLDKYDEIVAVYDKKFPGRQGTAVKQLFEPPQPVGTFASIRGVCHDDWGIECDDRFDGITPITPDCTTSGFPEVATLQPAFRWKPSARDDVSYDLILYEAAAYAVAGAGVPSYMRGRVVAYEEDLEESSWQPSEPLKPDTKYIWSVRLRDDDIVSGWSTQSHFSFLIVAMSSGYGQWFQFQTS